MTRPIVATINRAALRQNLAVARQAAAGSRLWSVVKANAYGHGIERVWQTLQSDGFALLNLEEAILLRERGWQGPILLLEGFFHPDELPLLDRYRLTTSVHSEWQIKALASARLSAPLAVYLKINSGMNRLGFRPEAVKDAWQRLQGLANVDEVTLMAHFAEGENAQSVNAAMVTIEKGVAGIPAARSLANSAALLWHPQTHHDWVRPGIILYGASPSGMWADIADSGLRPVMTLRSEIIGIQQLKRGDAVGYGACYHAETGQRIGVVACGYADGYPRLAATGTPIAVDGVITRVVGRVSMDMITVDLTPCPQATLGSRVELWGEQVKIDDVAAAAGTVGYELMCALAPRVPVEVI